ncbi:MAG: aquaporin [Solirubrobacteraceae bacterium]|nr:aquaporin [Solirubrobacteraceae bacterium]
MEDRGWPAYVVEFVGTFILVFAICMAAVANSPGGLGFTDFVTIGLVHAIALAALVAAFGGTSGGHFNPAVTTTLAALRKISPIDAVIYILVQLAGAVAAALVIKLVINQGTGALNPAEAANFGAPSIDGNKFIDGALAGGILEALGVFVLLTAIMGVAVNVRANQAWTPLIIGLTLGLAFLIIGPMTGGALNPARAFGPTVVAGDLFDGFGTFLVVYVLGPIVGGFLAGVFYTGVVLRPQEAEFGGRLVDTDVPPSRAEGAIESALEGPGERPEDKLS